MSNRNAIQIGGWTAQNNGLEFGKYLEYVIEDVPTQRGGKFTVFEIFKPYVIRNGQNAGQVGRGHSYPFPDGHRELVEKINHMIMNFGNKQGIYVFQPYGLQAQPPAYGQPAPQQFGQPAPGYVGAPVPQPVAQAPAHQGFAGYPNHPGYTPPPAQAQPAPQPTTAAPAPQGGYPAWQGSR